MAVVGVGALLPDAPDAAAFWRNVTEGRYSITDVDPARWDPALYFDPDPAAPAKTYSKIGGWVRDWEWNPLGWKLPIPPKVSDAMDDGQKWAVACTRMALLDYGWPERDLDRDRTGVIIGSAMSGEKHYLTALRISFPEIARELEAAGTFGALPADTRAKIEAELHANLEAWLPEITEDTMPGELGNVMAGRVANVFDLHGPNFITDAACASAMAAMDAAIEGLVEHEFDAVVTGGVDRNMGASSFVKFCAIGALSATGTRPYADGADGFVMGEGAALFVLKRLADAERDGDRIYAVVRAIAGSSDGKGKGITAPNPVGQRFAVERAWAAAGLSPAECTLVEGHGTSTRVGDVVEVTSLMDSFAGAGLAPGSVALGSVKSNIGHLKGAAGAAGLLKAVLALDAKVLPPSINFERPNPNLDWSASPFRVNTELRDWDVPAGRVRTAGVSAFGFGGTNFHAVLEEHVPGRFEGAGNGRASIAVPAGSGDGGAPPAEPPKAPLRGALVAGAPDAESLAAALDAAVEAAAAGPPAAPAAAALRAPERIAIDYADADDLAAKAALARKALQSPNPATWLALRGRGIFRGSGSPGKVAFLYTGQGSQYANMLADLRGSEPAVAAVFDEADRIMAPLLEGRKLSDIIFVDRDDPDAVARAEEELRHTEITQPAVLATDIALTALLDAYGIRPDLVMGHSLGEYGALVAAGALSFEAALEAVSARGREMVNVQPEDPGAMAAVGGPTPEEVAELLDSIDGYAVIANVNSTSQVVIGGATEAVGQAVAILQERGHTAIPLPVSHAFHTSIVAGASAPLRATLQRLGLRPPRLPIVANVDGEFYPSDGDVTEQMLDILARQVASPVQFVKGLHTLYDAGARVFVEVGPKRALATFASDVLGDDAVLSVSSNHPKLGDVPSFSQALCGLYAAGLGAGAEPAPAPAAPASAVPAAPAAAPAARPAAAATPGPAAPSGPLTDATYAELGHLLADVLERGRALVGDGTGGAPAAAEPVVITGAALGLPGTERLFDDGNVARILHGEQFIDVIPQRQRHEILDKHITRLVKSDDGSAGFETIDRLEDVIKLAARAGEFDLATEFGVEDGRIGALGRATQLAVAAGIDALRDAGIPLVQHYKTTTTGSQLPDRWMLPERLRDGTGIIFASAFPGLEEMTSEVTRFWQDHSRREQLTSLESLRARLAEVDGEDSVAVAEVQRRIHDLRLELESDGYTFDRRFLFRVLSMGHSQFAELIGARGPNTQVNAACASTTQAVAIAEDWIRAGRCARVIVVASDDATSDTMLSWIGAGFLASGAAATDEVVEEAALPFDQRRHGMLLGMGAAALVVESAAAARDRGIRPICEVLGAVTANSAFHGTRLDVSHIGQVMEEVLGQAEARGVDRHAIAAETVFISHETYTPARGGSASAEIHALRETFGADADRLVIANTKGLTGHPMGVGIEDVVAVKSLETGLVPAVPNFKEVDPELGELNLSKGGAYPIRHALRLAAGFGSQIAMMLLRWTPVADGRHRNPEELGYAYRIADPSAWARWLQAISGQEQPELEVVTRRLRVVDRGPAALTAAPAAAPPAAAPPAAPAPAPAPVPAPAPAAPAPEPAPAPAPVPADDGVAGQVLAVVAEQTGYPEDLLDMDLDLEADLGIDTVKQAEVFAAIREQYGIERDDSLKLRDYPTLNHVVGFVRERADVPDPAAPADAAPPGDGGTPPAADSDDGVSAAVLAVVAGQTGYPEDLLDMDLDLEADLGIDTVKQAEVFAAIREQYGIERDDSLKLRDYPTLNHVVGFVRERASLGAPEAGASADGDAPDPAGAAVPAGDGAPAGYPRRVPVPVLRPALGLCAPTGVEVGAGARIVLMPDGGGVGTALAARLEARGAEVLAIDGAPEAAALEAQLEAWAAEGPIRGVYWLPALDAEGPLAGLDPAAAAEALRVRVKLLAVAMRALAGHVDAAGTFLVAATRLGGRHGAGADGAASTFGGAVTGFTKALAREREAATIKAVDFAPSRKTAALADLLIEETERDPGAVEVGHADGLRWAVALAETDAVPDPARALSADTTFLVTGAAGSIVSAITADLAAASGGTFHLLDRVPAPDPGDPDLRRFAEDRDGLKRDLADRIRSRGEKATPKLVERELAVIERARAAQDAIDAIQAAGGTATWHQADLTDPEQVQAAVAAALADSPRIDVLLHCAGLEISHFLPDKTQAEWDLVFDVKAHGWINLLAALRDADVGTAVGFSSIAGRFGNAGQTDYAAANDLLCKSVAAFRRDRPGTRGITIDWTAWADIGMAARGSIPKMMELAGIDMLPPAEGIPAVRRELEAEGPGGEVLVAGALGVLLDERDPAGGLDLEAAAGPVAAGGPMLGAPAGMTSAGELRILTTLDPAEHGFLADHRIEGTPVLPGVMGIEAFAEAATVLLPGWVPVAAEDVAFLAPFKFYRDEPRELDIRVALRDGGDGTVVARCRLLGRRPLPSGDVQETEHFTATVRCAPAADPAPASAPPAGPDGAVVDREAVYGVYFHGPAYQVLDAAWPADGTVVGRLAGGLPPNHAPSGDGLRFAPRLIELCFQTAGIWEIGTTGRMALPAGIDRVTVDPGAAEADGLHAVVVPSETGVSAEVRDAEGHVAVRLDGYRTIELPGGLEADALAPIRAAIRE
ncbi:MAG: SDR family NAD(P)-dependent oxidoreductase [Solirubrobacteraceae bacterium]